MHGGKWGIILGEWEWLGHYFEWVGHYFGWVEVDGKIFWVSRGGWGWVGVSGGGCTI